jgi:predicted TIM-barrel fold metal-dependent hydrolase
VESTTLLRDGYADPAAGFRFEAQSMRLVWTAQGEDCTKQVYPLGLPGLGCEAPALVAEMDYSGVDVGLLNVDHTLGRSVEYLANCVHRFPERLISMLPVDEWRAARNPEAVLQSLGKWRTQPGFRAIKYIPWYAYRNGVLDRWDGPQYESFWSGVAELDLPVFFTLAPHPDAGDEVSGFIAEMAMLGRLMQSHPSLRCSITHGFPYRALLRGDALVVPDAMWEVFENPRLTLEVGFPVRIGDIFAYPYREVWPVVEEMCVRIGPDRLLWGSDMPFQNRFCTYRQSREWLAEFLDTSILKAIMGRTAARVLGLDQAPEPAGSGSQAPDSRRTT